MISVVLLTFLELDSNFLGFSVLFALDLVSVLDLDFYSLIVYAISHHHNCLPVTVFTIRYVQYTIDMMRVKRLILH